MPAVSITVSEAAGIISAATTVMSVTFSMAIVTILVALVNNKTTVNGWSTIGAMIQQSPWPVLLRTDAIRSLNVQTSVNIISKLTLLGTFLTAITGIVTPLGLQDIVIDQNPSVQDMSYIKDNGPMGMVTTPREKYQEGRLCINGLDQNCPGAVTGQLNGSSTAKANTQIPSNITSKFSSPTDQGAFNIQYRIYTTQVSSGVNNNQPITVGSFGRMQSFITGNNIIAIEGAVVDTTKTPGIGLTQHSFPNDEKSSTWNRELLWLEPESACVDTNLTLQYQISYDLITMVENSTVVVDKGGIANLTTKQPPPYSDNSTFIDLAFHAYTGAVWSNLAAMRAFNTTRTTSKIGKAYQIHPLSENVGQLTFSPLDYIPSVASADFSGYQPDVANYIDAYCRGYNGTDMLDGSKRLVGCVLLMGLPRQLNVTNNAVMSNTTYEQPIYSCATAIRASIQETKFTMTQPITNSSNGFASLRISRQNTNTSTLWAVEKTGMNMTSANPYWGPVSASYASDPDLFTEEGEFMYLPPGLSDYGRQAFGIVEVSSSDSQGCSIPGRIFSAMKYVVNQGQVPSSTSIHISSQNDYKLNKLWQNLTSSAQNASQVINLVWTDLMANNAIGVGYHPTALISSLGESVSYNLVYAIPAFVTLVLWFPIFVFALILLFANRVTLHELKNAINQTSVGRSVVNMINPTSDSLAKTDKWVKNEGKTKIGIKLEKSASGARAAKFDYDPAEQPLHRSLQALSATVDSGLRSRKPTEFTRLEDVDDK